MISKSMVSVVYHLKLIKVQPCNSYSFLRFLLSKRFYREMTYLRDMADDSTIKSLILLVLAIIIVIALWRTLWFLAGVAIFIFVVYIVYQLLKDKL